MSLAYKRGIPKAKGLIITAVSGREKGEKSFKLSSDRFMRKIQISPRINLNVKFYTF